MTEWQDISTAPKDGTSIIVMYIHIDTEIVHAAFWIDADETSFGDPDDVGWWTYDWNECGRAKMDGIYSPTHWMPLPPAPPKKGDE